MDRIAILGSTGSIGRQAIQVASLHTDRFEITALCAHKSAELLFEQARLTNARVLGLTGGEVSIPDDLKDRQWYFGEDALEKIAADESNDTVLAAVVGVVGLKSVLTARKHGKRVLLANKETLVAGGELVMSCCRPEKSGPVLLPVDSEHSAIFQCIHGEENNPVERIWLTASGGPFRKWSRERIQNATVEEALGHPTWNMGSKITVDSASMFNKALEVIEAKWLFDVSPERIQVAVHPQSVIHSMVEFRDGAVKAQLGFPDMRVPILYAMSFPERLETQVKRPDFGLLRSLEFEEPDPERFHALRLAYEVLKAGGTAPCILNAANEEAAMAFLAGRIPFGRIEDTVEAVLDSVAAGSAESLEKILEADRAAREKAREMIG